MSGTRELQCKCQSYFQDNKYGKGRRIYNLNGDNSKGRCSVCHEVKQLK